MTANPTPAAAQDEAVDVERLGKDAVLMAQTKPCVMTLSAYTVLALLSRLRATDQRAAELEAANAVLRAAAKEMLYLIGDSRGVDGFHLNGDVAEWGEFELVGQIEAALRTTPAEALEKIRTLIGWAESMAAPGTKFTDLRRIFGPPTP